ncbi:hypothetical protein BJ508DRAFT_333183 [Ascobolus immersus RN42]|uniref:Uncharacterized protein n=1 Tax=Ascobolus immersus RN42 TaxID=1160509 RepID=A0A3N4HMY3_ASCIM|nr:hypothetical protein BJ508DRAFT_333183 [Ascobolus immersus RN42]
MPRARPYLTHNPDLDSPNIIMHPSYTEAYFTTKFTATNMPNGLSPHPFEKVRTSESDGTSSKGEIDMPIKKQVCGYCMEPIAFAAEAVYCNYRYANPIPFQDMLCCGAVRHEACTINGKRRFRGKKRLHRDISWVIRYTIVGFGVLLFAIPYLYSSYHIVSSCHRNLRSRLGLEELPDLHKQLRDILNDTTRPYIAGITECRDLLKANDKRVTRAQQMARLKALQVKKARKGLVGARLSGSMESAAQPPPNPPPTYPPPTYPPPTYPPPPPPAPYAQQPYYGQPPPNPYQPSNPYPYYCRES